MKAIYRAQAIADCLAAIQGGTAPAVKALPAVIRHPIPRGTPITFSAGTSKNIAAYYDRKEFNGD